ncbi:MAG: AcrR family transcriptional regulator [Hyphomicrobiaceae bacterium]|jgi:AcrR family transcriptional regulator
MATQLQRRENTRGQLVAAAEALFTARGFASTSTSEILAAAGVSRGALYHHFATKQELFAAVFELVSARAIQRAISRTSGVGTAMDRLEAGCLAWLDEAQRPEVATILLDQGPAVLGWQGAREIENRSSLCVMKAAVGAAAEGREFAAEDVAVIASVLNAVLAELALIQCGDSFAASRTQVVATLRLFLGGMKASLP